MKKKKKFRKVHHFSALNKAAVLVLAIFLTFSSMMVTVQAFRLSVLNFLISIEPKYTSYELQDDESGDNEKLIVNWTNSYVPSYMPEGYEVTEMSSSDSLKKVILENADSSSIIYTEYESDSSLSIDTEDASLGKAHCSGSVDASSNSYYVNLTVTLQKKNNSSWENVKSWSESGNGQSGLIIEKDYYVASGTYRVLTTAKIYNSTVTTLLETESFNSKEQTY